MVIGFERNFTSVDESVGTFELCVLIFTDENLLPDSFSFSLDLFSTSVTAGKTNHLNSYNGI